MYIKISERTPTGTFEDKPDRIKVEDAYKYFENIAEHIDINEITDQEQYIEGDVKLIHIWSDDDIIITVDDIDHDIRYKIRCYGLTDKTYYEVIRAAKNVFGYKDCEQCINFYKKENYKFFGHCSYYNSPIRESETDQAKRCFGWNNLDYLNEEMKLWQ